MRVFITEKGVKFEEFEIQEIELLFVKTNLIDEGHLDIFRGKVIKSIFCISPLCLKLLNSISTIERVNCTIMSDEELEAINDKEFKFKINANINYSDADFNLITNPNIYFFYDSSWYYYDIAVLCSKSYKVIVNISERDVESALLSPNCIVKKLILQNSQDVNYINFEKVFSSRSFESLKLCITPRFIDELIPHIGDVKRICFYENHGCVININKILQNEHIKKIKSDCVVVYDKEILANNFTLIEASIVKDEAVEKKAKENKKIIKSMRFKRTKVAPLT